MKQRERESKTRQQTTKYVSPHLHFHLLELVHGGHDDAVVVVVVSSIRVRALKRIELR